LRGPIQAEDILHYGVRIGTDMAGQHLPVVYHSLAAAFVLNTADKIRIESPFQYSDTDTPRRLNIS
jgi:hypothetical protein